MQASPSFSQLLRATLKSWEEPGDEATSEGFRIQIPSNRPTIIVTSLMLYAFVWKLIYARQLIPRDLVCVYMYAWALTQRSK